MPIILTVGHSNRELVPFIDLLQEYGVEKVVDIRTMSSNKRQAHALTSWAHVDGTAITYPPPEVLANR